MGCSAPRSVVPQRAASPSIVLKRPGICVHQFILTSAWGTIFTLNALLAFGKMESFLLQPWQYETTNYVLLVCGAILTSWYPNRVRSRAARTAPARGSEESVRS